MNNIPITGRYDISVEEIRNTNLNQLIVGVCGSGKTYRHVIPQILAFAGNYIVFDRTDSIFAQTGDELEKADYRIIRLDINDFDTSDENVLKQNILETVMPGKNFYNKCAVFISGGFSEEMKTFAECFISAVMSDIAVFPVFTNIIIDDCCAGIDGIEKYFAKARTMNMRFVVAAQSYTQLDTAYGKENLENIFANTHIHTCLSPAVVESDRFYVRKIFRISPEIVKIARLYMIGNGCISVMQTQ